MQYEFGISITPLKNDSHYPRSNSVNTTDRLCTKLKTDATTQISASPPKVFTWDMIDANRDSIWALTYYHPNGIGPDYTAEMMFQDSVLYGYRTQKENARTIIHEAYHAFARSGNDTVAESLAVNVCVL